MSIKSILVKHMIEQQKINEDVSDNEAFVTFKLKELSDSLDALSKSSGIDGWIGGDLGSEVPAMVSRIRTDCNNEIAALREDIRQLVDRINCLEDTQDG